MTEKRSPVDSDAQQKFTLYHQLARELCGPFCRTRAGFGAFRHLRRLLAESIRLAMNSGIFVPCDPLVRLSPLLLSDFDPLLFAALFRRPLNHRDFFERVLGSPSSYDPPSFWALFWALAKAEHEFLQRYTVFWSHEERLTGHLVAQILERIEEFAIHWQDLSSRGQEPTYCRIWYADTATARREQITGADLGLVIHAKLPRISEYFKVVRFQAKKVGANGAANIDLDQVEALTQKENLGYYLFYHRLDEKHWSPPPTVSSASRFVEDLNARKMKSGANKPWGTVSRRVRDEGWDFATFITFGVADLAAEHGVLADGPEDAARTLMSSDGPTPSRVLVLTLGEGAQVIDWHLAFSEYIGLRQLDDMQE